MNFGFGLHWITTFVQLLQLGYKTHQQITKK